MAKSFVSDYVMPHKSPMERFQRDPSMVPDGPGQLVRETCVLRGWLNREETDSLLSLIEEDDCNLHSVLLAAGLLALARTLNFQKEQEIANSNNSFAVKSFNLSNQSYNDTAHSRIRFVFLCHPILLYNL